MMSSRAVLAALLVGTLLAVSGAFAQEAEPKADPFLSYDFEALLKQYDDYVATDSKPFGDVAFPFYQILDSLDYVSTSAPLDEQVDVNGSQSISNGVVTVDGNTMPDLFEFGILRAVLASQDQYSFGVELPAGLAADREAIRNAFTANLQAIVSAGSLSSHMSSLGSARRDLAYVLAAHSMIGNGAVTTNSPGNYAAGGSLGFLHAIFDNALGQTLAVDNTFQKYFASGQDADGDGFMNYLEYIAYGKLGPYAYVRRALTPDTNYYRVRVSSNSSGGRAVFTFPVDWTGEIFLPGTEIKLTAAANSGYRFESWRLNDVLYNSTSETITVPLTDQQQWGASSVAERNFVATFREVARLIIQSPSGQGSSSPVPGTYVYLRNQTVALTATANVGWRFLYWEVNGQTRTDSQIDVLLGQADTTVKPYFVQTQNFKLDVLGALSITDAALNPPPAETTPAPGTTVPPKGTYTYTSGLEAIITATPNTNWDFAYWIVTKGAVIDITNTARELRLVITEDTKVQPVFSQNFTLIMSADGEGSVTPTPGTYQYPAGQSVVISATPRANSRFDRWVIEGQNVTTNPYTLVMNAGKTVKAIFKPVYTIQARVSPAGSGQVVLTPASGPYLEGSQVSANATPAQGYALHQWEVRLTDNTQEQAQVFPPTNPLTVTVDSDKYITAVYKQAVYLTVFMNAASQTYGDTDPAPGRTARTVGSVVTLTASPKPGGEFVNWTITGIASPITEPIYDLVVGQTDMTVRATFQARPKYTLTVTNDPVQGGTISTDPASLSGSALEYYGGTNVLLTAAPKIALLDNPRYRFVGWTGDVPTVSSTSVTVPMTSNKVAVAHYQRVYALTTGVNGEGQVRVSQSPGLEGFYDEGADIVLTAANDQARWRLDKWLVNGVSAGVETTLNLKMTRDTSVIAVFQEIPVYTLSVLLDPPAAGRVIPSNGRADYVQQLAENSLIDLVPVPNDGYEFLGWEGDPGVINADKSLTVTMSTNKTIVAKFARLYRLSIIPGSAGGVVSTYPEPTVQSSYPEGLNVLLRARPEKGYRFDRWSRALGAQENPAIVTMDSDIQVSPFFKRVFTLAGSITGSGSVELNWGGNTLLLPEGPDTASNPSVPAPEAGKIPVKISIQPTKSAIKWSMDGGASWLDNGVTKNVAPGRYTVVFKGVDGWQTPVDVPLTILDTDESVVRTITTNRVYDEGSYVELVAKPAADNHFVGFRWPDGTVTTDVITSLQMNGDKTFECVFAAGPAPTSEGEELVEGDVVEGDQPASSGCAGF